MTKRSRFVPHLRERAGGVSAYGDLSKVACEWRGRSGLTAVLPCVVCDGGDVRAV